MYGTWFGTTMIGALALLALVALIVLASPLFAVLLALLVLALVASAFVLLRGQQARAGGGAGAGRIGPNPRSGGEPVSGEGHASGGETAGQRSSQRR
jgi:hypothetical protein